MLNRMKSRVQKHLLSRAGLVLQIGKELHVSKFRGAETDGYCLRAAIRPNDAVEITSRLVWAD
jgi:hypothetical protein